MNCDPIAALAPNGAAEASTTAADSSCQVNVQNTGTLTENHGIKDLVPGQLLDVFLMSHPLFSIVYEMTTNPPPLPPPRPLSKLLTETSYRACLSSSN